MYVFPVLRWLKVFSQTWEGDVTMVLPSSYMQLKKSITNPSHADLLKACKQVRSPLPGFPKLRAAALLMLLQQGTAVVSPATTNARWQPPCYMCRTVTHGV